MCLPGSALPILFCICRSHLNGSGEGPLALSKPPCVQLHARGALARLALSFEWLQPPFIACVVAAFPRAAHLRRIGVSTPRIHLTYTLMSCLPTLLLQAGT